MEIKKYDGVERRKALRVTYASGKRPVLKVGENRFEIADVSEKGVRFFNTREIDLKGWVKGTIILLCGESIDVEGAVEREAEAGVYLRFNKLISQRILYREQRHMNYNDAL